MALGERALAFLFVMAALQAVCYAAVYKVGDSAGWTLGNVDYKQWAATKTFHVGDIILFEYNAQFPQFHNVIRTIHAEYKTCNSSAPIATYTTGNDSITISTLGHHYFFCGAPGHCQAGQKVDINVLRPSWTPTPYASPPSSTPTVSEPEPVPAPWPSPSASPPSTPTVSEPEPVPAPWPSPSASWFHKRGWLRSV